MIGRNLSHYTILDELSRGGMGVVYRAVDVNLKRNVAIKVLPPHSVADSGQKWRFIQEAQAAAALEHPNIAAIYRIDEADGVIYIVMELIQGEKLSDLMKSEPLPVARALELATEVAQGLAAAHDKGIVHRDLKPANVMVTTQGHAKIIDFGLAKLLQPSPADGDLATALRAETDPRFVVGTVPYMSPEQARGGKVDHRTDVFSFGITFYEMLTGLHPFRGGNAIETLSAILSATPPPLGEASQLESEAMGNLQAIVDKCLAKDAAERFQSTKDLIIDLRQARRKLELGASDAVISTPPSTSSRLPFALGALAVVGALLGAFLLGRTPRDGDLASGPPTLEKPSIAVMY
ncbi:MAG: serine/threonine-protein kinase, partial [Vicinamibacteria bacterium]